MENDQQTPPEETKSNLPKGLFAAVKATILELDPKNKKHQEAVGQLKASECEVASSKGSTFIVHAGKFGVRKVTL